MRRVWISLTGLALALLLVGVVSGTLLRHVVQIIPLIVAAVLLKRSPQHGAYAALPIFVWWIFIVTMIWLFLLGVSNFASGKYTPIEIVSTVLMAGFSVLGIMAAVQEGKPLAWAQRIALFIVFAVVQVGAMLVSFLKPIANR
jgi:hypothetical protein